MAWGDLRETVRPGPWAPHMRVGPAPAAADAPRRLLVTLRSARCSDMKGGLLCGTTHCSTAGRSAESITCRGSRSHRSQHAAPAGLSPPSGASDEVTTAASRQRRPSASTARTWRNPCGTPSSGSGGFGGEWPPRGYEIRARTPGGDWKVGLLRINLLMQYAALVEQQQCGRSDELIVMTPTRLIGQAVDTPATAAAATAPEGEPTAGRGFAAARRAAGRGSGAAGRAADRTEGRPPGHRDRHRCSCFALMP